MVEYDVCYGDTVGTQTSMTVGTAGDDACFNMGVGSIVVDCTSAAGSLVGTSLTTPPLHGTTQFLPYFSSPVTNVNNSIALWTDSECQAGTGEMNWYYTNNLAPRGKCLPMIGDYYYTYFRITCSTNQPSSAWTLQAWNGTVSIEANVEACTANTNPAYTLHSSGFTCTATPYASVLVDCTSRTQTDFINYIPDVDGGWSDWSDCSASCTQTRTCSNPASSGAGVPCLGSSWQPCSASPCVSSAGDLSSSAAGTGQSASDVGSATATNSGSAYSASVTFFLTFRTAVNATFIQNIQTMVASMAGVSTQQVQVTAVSSTSGTGSRRLLQASASVSNQLEVTILAASSSATQAAYSQFQTAFASTDATANPLLSQSVDTSAAPVAVYSVTCADGSTQASTSDCNAGINSGASSFVAATLAPLALASFSVLFNAVRA